MFKIFMKTTSQTNIKLTLHTQRIGLSPVNRVMINIKGKRNVKAKLNECILTVDYLVLPGLPS